MSSTNSNLNRIVTFTTGVALGLSILSGTASAAPATPAEPSADGYEGQAQPPDDVVSDGAAPPVVAALPAVEAASPVVVDTSAPTAPPVVIDEPVAPPPAAAEGQAVVPDAAFTQVRPFAIAVPRIPASPVVALAPGNWGMSARVVGERKAQRVLSFDSTPSPQVRGARLVRVDTLPRTGVDTGLLTVVAIILLAAGTVLARQGRAPSPAPAGAGRPS